MFTSFILWMAVMCSTVESAQFQPQQSLRLCGERYKIETHAEEFHGDIEIYEAIKMSTGERVRLTSGLPIAAIERNYRFSHHLEADPTVDSSYFLRVHCITTITHFGKHQQKTAIQVEDQCPSLHEFMERAKLSFSPRTVELQLLPGLKEAIKEMRKLSYVHGNLDIRTVFWCPRRGTPNSAGIQLGGFYASQIVADGATSTDQSQRYHSTSDLLTVASLILEMLQAPHQRQAWEKQLIESNNRDLVDLIDNLWRPQHSRLSFPAFYQRVDKLRQKAQAEDRMERQAGPSRPESRASDSFDAAIDSMMSD